MLSLALKEVSNIIDGFEYGQKKLGGGGKSRVIRAAYGCKIQLLEFLNINVENNDNVLINNSNTSNKFSTNDTNSLDTKENEINFNHQTVDENDDVDGTNAELLYECYYCANFTPTTDEVKYQKHGISIHPKKRLYPTLSELKEMGIEPKGKRWEI